MGKSSSKPVPTLLLDEPWRTMNWGDKQSVLQYVNNYTPPTEGQQFRILLHGLVGAGKSSFINSVKSVLEGRMCRSATVGRAHECFTKEYKTYRIKKGNADTFHPFVINDMMGLKNSGRRSRRNHVKDLNQIFKGHVKDGYTFNPECKMSKEDRHYNESPDDNDKVHVLVYVLDASTISVLLKDKDIMDTIQDIREDATDLDIPQVAILTKIDKACPEIKNDLKNVYKSKLLHEKMEEVSETMGLPMNCIFPVKNYHDEINFDIDIDTLILSTLKSIIDDRQ